MITDVPTTIDKFTSLETLIINDNPLFKIPKEIATCPKLRKLIASNCGIEELPYEVGTMTNLLLLDLDSCPLKPKLLSAYEQGKTIALKLYLQRKFERRQFMVPPSIFFSLRNRKKLSMN